MGMISAMKLKAKWEKFCKNHPKVPLFVDKCNEQLLTEGTIIDIKVTRPDGTTLCTNVKLLPEDLELLQDFKSAQ